MPRDKNTRLRWEREHSETETSTQFAIALFAGHDRTAVRQQMVSLKDLVRMLTTFEVLTDKHPGRCWSPTLYAEGHTSRANAGVASVSALVFDVPWSMRSVRGGTAERAESVSL